jgi:predicted heme/steroid binding protein
MVDQVSLNLIPLQIQPGLVKDDTPFTVRQGGYTDVNNVRPRENGMEVIGGWEFLTTETITGKCRGMHSWVDNDGEHNLAIGTHSKLYVYVGGKVYDITPTDFVAGNEDGTGGAGYGTGTYSTGTYGGASSGDFYPVTWSFGNYGETLIANARGQKIWQWSNNTGSAAVAVTNAPTDVECILVTAQRQIVAYGCNEETSGTKNPRCARWCDIEDITDWTTATTNNAGEFVLRNSGRIVRAMEMGQAIGVWTDEGMFWQDFVGAIGETYRFTRAGASCGLIGPNAVTVMGSQAFWCGPDYRFRTVGLGGEPITFEAPIDQDFEDSKVHAQQEKIYASSMAEFNEVWWFYPHSDDGNENSRYFAVNIKTGKWFEGQLPRSAFIDAGPYQYPLGVGADGYIYIHERGTTAAGNAVKWHAETGPVYLENSGRVFQIRSIRPDLHDQRGAVTFQLKSRLYPQGSITEHTPEVLTAGQDKADFRASGAIVKMRWSSDLIGAVCRLGQPVFDVTTRGRR